jgi:hypothetical protein
MKLLRRLSNLLLGQPQSSFSHGYYATRLAFFWVEYLSLNCTGVKEELSGEKTEISSETITKEQTNSSVLFLGQMEKKILKTLWSKQVNRVDTWPGSWWIFRPGFSDTNEPLAWVYWAAVMQLYIHGLVKVNENSMIRITSSGLRFCADHQADLGDEEFWPQEPIKTDKISQLIEKLKTVSD